MGNLFNALNGLKTNIFGGGNTGTTTPILRKHAIGMNPQGPLSVSLGKPEGVSVFVNGKEYSLADLPKNRVVIV